jgi:hypothetical protein
MMMPNSSATLGMVLDLGPFRPALLPQEMEGDRLHQREALHAGSELARGLERQGCPVRVADEVKRAFGFLGDGRQHVQVGFALERLISRPGA